MASSSRAPTEPVSAQLRTVSPLWRTPRFLAALASIVVGFAGGAVLADGVMENADLSAFDPTVTADFIGVRTEVVTAVARAFTFVGSTAALVPLTLGLIMILLLRRRWGAAVAVAWGMSLSLTITVLLKSSIGRARPPAHDVLGAINNGFAFPSGHTLNGTVFVGLVAGLLLARCRTRWARAVSVGVALALAVGIGLSRVYLGYHWLTDVMAGWSLATGVLGTVVLACTLLDRRRLSRPRP
ncbi:MAG: phosphatase PAP2 family protein [Ornithinimicrobium sp.]